jgi:hypothetical protein
MKGTIGALSEGDILISEGANPEINFSAPQDAFNIFCTTPRHFERNQNSQILIFYFPLAKLFPVQLVWKVVCSAGFFCR